MSAGQGLNCQRTCCCLPCLRASMSGPSIGPRGPPLLNALCPPASPCRSQPKLLSICTVSPSLSWRRSPPYLPQPPCWVLWCCGARRRSGHRPRCHGGAVCGRRLLRGSLAPAAGQLRCLRRGPLLGGSCGCAHSHSLAAGPPDQGALRSCIVKATVSQFHHLCHKESIEQQWYLVVRSKGILRLMSLESASAAPSSHGL